MPQVDTSILYELGLSESEVKMYLTLIDRGSLSAQELVREAGIKRPTVYYGLRQLIDKGLVHRTGTHAVERFQAEPPGKLLSVLLWRRQSLEGLEKKIKELIPHLSQSKITHEGIPQVLFYEGEEAMKQAITDTLYCRSKKIDFLTPHDNFFWQTDKKFSANYVAERTERGIKTRHLWEAPLAPNYMSNFRSTAEIRLLPKEMNDHFRTTTLIFDETVMYISSHRSGYVLLVKSREHFEFMSAIFNTLWVVSKAVGKK